MLILVTGADGFIGSHLVEGLIKAGYEVRSIVQYNSFNSLGWLSTISKEKPKNLQIISGDIRDGDFLASAAKNCNVIINLAALIAIPYSYNAPKSYIDTNVYGTLNVLQSARSNKIDQIIHISTSEIYGTAQYAPINEQHPINPQSPYAASKASADFVAKSFFASFDLPVSIIRPFNTYGPRQSARAVIPSIITQVASGKTKIQLGNLSTTRDFSFIDDTVSGVMSAIGNTDSFGQEINLGSGFEISILQLTELISDAIGNEISIEVDEKRLRPVKSEVDRLVSDNQKAKTVLGWTPPLCWPRWFENGVRTNYRVVF